VAAEKSAPHFIELAEMNGEGNGEAHGERKPFTNSDSPISHLI